MSSNFGELQVTPTNLLPIAQPIHIIITWFCAFGVFGIIMSTIINFYGGTSKKKHKIIKPIRYSVVLFYGTSFTCLILRCFTWSLIFDTKHCQTIKYFFPTLYLLQKTMYYEFLIIRLKATFEESVPLLKKPLFDEKIWCLKAYNYTQYVFFTFWMLISTDVPANAQYKSKFWGLWCEEHYSKSFIIPYVMSDSIYSITVLMTYIKGLQGLINIFDHRHDHNNRNNNDNNNKNGDNDRGSGKRRRKHSLNEKTKSLKASILEIAKVKCTVYNFSIF